MTTRRQILCSAAAVAAGATANTLPALAADPPAPLKGRVKQSTVYWCFNARGEKWDAETTCRHAKAVGCVSVELIPPEHYPVVRKHGLTCAIASNGMPGAFVRGFNNPRHRDQLLTVTKTAIDQCADAGFPSVIGFVGMQWVIPDDPKSGSIAKDEAFKNCVEGLKMVAGHAEKAGVTICVEHLNTRDSSDPMKGHPGYQGDDLDFVVEIVRKVGSPRVKVLFDIYHVQLMHGDLIRRIEQTKDVIGHVHTAGVPGRGELDDNQEVHYPAVIRKLVEVGYTGYVGQEFIPTRNPLEGLKQAVRLCDV